MKAGKVILCVAVVAILLFPLDFLAAQTEVKSCPNKESSLKRWVFDYHPYRGGRSEVERWYSVVEHWSTMEDDDCFQFLDFENLNFDSLSLFTVEVSSVQIDVLLKKKPADLKPQLFAELAFILKKLEHQQLSRPIYVHFSAYGGWVEVAVSLVKLLKNSGANVTLVLDETSICYSACAVVTSGWKQSLVHDQAMFGFHGGHQKEKDAFTGRTKEVLTPEATDYYLLHLKGNGVSHSWLSELEKDGVFSTTDFYVVPAGELKGLGLF